MKTSTFFLIAAVSLTLSCQSHPAKSPASPPTVIRASALREDTATARAEGARYAISTQGDHATQAGRLMMEQGGNLMDAAVAASFVISVERPHSTGIGGGGFMVFREAATGRVHAIDFRERAPLKAHRKMYLGPDGKALREKSLDGHSAVAVPGLVAGLIEVHARFGKLPLATVLQPAIDLAENGLRVYPKFQEALKNRAAVLRQDPAARALFLDSSGEALAVGALLVQKDLARTLRAIATKGRDGFYKGAVAKAIVDSQKRGGGLVSQADLDQYKVLWREPVHARTRGYDVYSMPPPSSGGVHVIQFLKMTEARDRNEKDPHGLANLHFAAASLQSAFADRAKFLGDPDFVKVPTSPLISDAYLRARAAEIPRTKSRSADQVAAGAPPARESTETTHLSLMDADGNAIASTQTINGWMGAAVVAPGTGIVLNNEMDDFAAEIGGSNLFGAVGGEPNAIEPRKTPLSSMSPTILMRDGLPILSVGAPGGTRIISCVAQTVLNMIEFNRDLYDAITGIRYHHQWKPDVLWIDPPGPGPDTVEKLRKMGYEVRLEPVPCTVMGVARTSSGLLEAVADPRDIGTSAAQ